MKKKRNKFLNILIFAIIIILLFGIFYLSTNQEIVQTIVSRMSVETSASSGGGAIN